MIKREETVVIGKFQKTHALKGELNAILEIDPIYFEEGNPLIVELDGILVPFYVDSVRTKGSTSYLLKIDGVDSEATAAGFVNREIRMLKADLDENEDEIIDADSIVGFTILDDPTGNVIGVVEGVEDSTLNVLLIVDAGEENPVYIPYSEDFIVSEDIEKREIRMNLPEGLIELNKKNIKD